MPATYYRPAEGVIAHPLAHIRESLTTATTPKARTPAIIPHCGGEAERLQARAVVALSYQPARQPGRPATTEPPNQSASTPGGRLTRRSGRQAASARPPQPSGTSLRQPPGQSPRPHADPTPGHPGRQPPSQAASPPATCPANQPPVQAASKTARLPSSPPFRVPVRQAVREPAARPAAEVTDKPAIQPSRPRSSLHSKLLRSPALRSMHAGSLVRALCIRPLELR